MEKRETLSTIGGNKLMQPLWKKNGGSSKTLNTELPSDPALPFLGIYLKKMLTREDIVPSYLMQHYL